MTDGWMDGAGWMAHWNDGLRSSLPVACAQTTNSPQVTTWNVLKNHHARRVVCCSKETSIILKPYPVASSFWIHRFFF